MAEGNFFDLLREKLGAVRPSIRHRKDDWAALGARLDQALPQRAGNERRVWLIPFLLFLGLVLSNLFWWTRDSGHKAAIVHLRQEIAAIDSALNLPVVSPTEHRLDTVWKTVFLQTSYPSRLQWPSLQPERVRDGISLPDLQDRRAVGQVAGSRDPGGFQPLASIPFAAVSQHKGPVSGSVVLVEEDQRQRRIRTISRNVWNTIQPKSLKGGVVGGLIYPISAYPLDHQTGFEFGAQAIIGFSRHWSVLLDYAQGQLHYETDEASAILGSPHFPELTSEDFSYSHFKVDRQSIRNFHLGLRYTFSSVGGIQPYTDLSWGFQVLPPFTVLYELHHEPSSVTTSGRALFDRRIGLQDMVRLKAGFDIPLSQKLGLSVEGAFLRPWKQEKTGFMNFASVQIGANYLIL